MEYTINRLAALAGVSTRTLRYYDEIGLLRPSRTTPAGYRIYGPGEVDLLQQVLFYRALDFPLDEIARIVQAPGFDRREALRRQRDALCARQARLGRLIATIDRTLGSLEGGIPMEDQEKFEAFKARAVAQNEAAYGAEARRQYGGAAVDAANGRLLRMTQEEYARFQTLGAAVMDALAQAVREGAAPAGEAGRQAVALHRSWLSYSWEEYTAQAHKGLAQGYLDDPRFTAYYDREVPGCAQFLCDAVACWAGRA